MAEEQTQNQPNPSNPYPDPALLDSIINDPMAQGHHKDLVMSIKNDPKYQHSIAIQQGLKEDTGATEERPTETIANLSQLGTYYAKKYFGEQSKAGLSMEAMLPQSEAAVPLALAGLKSGASNVAEEGLSAGTISKTMQMGPKMAPTNAAQLGKQFPEVMAAPSIKQATKDYIESVGLDPTEKSLQNRFQTEYLKPTHWEQAIAEGEQGILTGKVPHGRLPADPETGLSPFTEQEALDAYHAASDALQQPKYLQEASKGNVGKMKDYLIQLKGDLGDYLEKQTGGAFKEATMNLRLAHLKEDALQLFPSNYNGSVNMLRSALMAMKGVGATTQFLGGNRVGAAKSAAEVAAFSPWATTRTIQGINLGLKAANKVPELGYFGTQLTKEKDSEEK